MNPTPVPTVALELDWEGDLRFTGRSAGVTLLLDGDAAAGPSPVQALLFGLAGCMAVDVVAILKKGRHSATAVHARLFAERAPQAPKRVTRVELHFDLRGDVPEPAVARAVELSRQTYCSVWHSLRADIPFTTSFTITRA